MIRVRRESGAYGCGHEALNYQQAIRPGGVQEAFLPERERTNNLRSWSGISPIHDSSSDRKNSRFKSNPIAPVISASAGVASPPTSEERIHSRVEPDVTLIANRDR